MANPARLGASFGKVDVDPGARRLVCNGREVPVSSKAFDVLNLLIERRGEVVDKEDFFSLVWSGVAVEESNLTQTVFQLRKALADNGENPEWIKTVPKRGYLLLTAPPRTSGPSSTNEVGGQDVASDKKNSFIALAVILSTFGFAYFLLDRLFARQLDAFPTMLGVAAVLLFTLVIVWCVIRRLVVRQK